MDARKTKEVCEKCNISVIKRTQGIKLDFPIVSLNERVNKRPSRKIEFSIVKK